MPKVTIIIPVYNVEIYIKKALDSVINQTLKDIEIICVNDCTPDNSFNIVKEYAVKDTRIILLEQNKNCGQGVARNRALDIATGEYIMFLDPDDWFELDACEKAYNKISKNNNEIVFFNYISHKYKNGKIVNSKIAKRLDKFQSIKNNQHLDLITYKEDWLTTSYTWVQIYSKKYLDNNNIRYSDDRFTEDIPFFIKAIACSKDISILDEPLYNALRKQDAPVYDYLKHYEDVITVKNKARKIVTDYADKTAFQTNYLLYEIRSNLAHLKNFCSRNKDAQKKLYPKIRERFLKDKENLPIERIKNSSTYAQFSLVIKCKSYNQYLLRRFIMKLLKLKF